MSLLLVIGLWPQRQKNTNWRLSLYISIYVYTLDVYGSSTTAHFTQAFKKQNFICSSLPCFPLLISAISSSNLVPRFNGSNNLCKSYRLYTHYCRCHCLQFCTFLSTPKHLETVQKQLEQGITRGQNEPLTNSLIVTHCHYTLKVSCTKILHSDKVSLLYCFFMITVI